MFLRANRGIIPGFGPTPIFRAAIRQMILMSMPAITTLLTSILIHHEALFLDTHRSIIYHEKRYSATPINQSELLDIIGTETYIISSNEAWEI